MGVSLNIGSRAGKVKSSEGVLQKEITRFGNIK